MRQVRTKKTIAIIGATGKMGSAITKSLAKENYRLILFSRDEQKAKALQIELKEKNKQLEIECSSCPYDASWEADIIILAVPYKSEKEVAQKIKEVATQKILISISNPLNKNYDGLITVAGTSAAEELQKLLPDSKLVKAFSTTFAANFNQTMIDGKQVDSFIAGDDKEAMETVSELVNAAGFNPIIAGDLSAARTLENMSLL